MVARGWIIGLALVLGAVGARAEGLAVGQWAVENGVYHGANAGLALYCLTNEPYLVGAGSVEATVVVTRRLASQGWAAAGVMVSSDAGNLWVLDLVEAPNGQRYTELMERCQNVHQAQSTGLTRLSRIDGFRSSSWEYGKAYSLRLTLAPDRVTGDVIDAATGQVVARQGYLLGNALAVRDGWATLRDEEFDARFTEVKVVAPPAAPAAAARQYPQGQRGCVGIYWGADLPGAEQAPQLDELTRVLSRAGLAVATLTSPDLADPGALTFPGLRYLVADLRRLPAGALLALKRWVRRGGVLVSLTAPAFGNFYWPGPDGWIDWDQYTQARLRGLARDARPIVTWSAAELAKLQQSLGGDAKRPATVGLAGTAPDGRPAAAFTLPHFHNGWWSADLDFESPPFTAAGQLVCLWAKGDPQTPAMSLEAAEQDGSRWVAVVSLSQEWRYCVLPPSAFVYWPDNPSKGRGGPGDQVKLENTVGLRWGISGTHTRAVLDSDAIEHHLTVGSVAVAAVPPAELAELAPAARPELEAMSPGYKLFEVKGAARWEPAVLGKLWGIDGQWPAVPCFAAVERPRGEGFGRGHAWRWIPLVKAVDGRGQVLGAPVSLLLNETLSLPRCAWLCVGALHAKDLARPELQAAIGTAVARLTAGPILFEGGADRFLAYPDEAVPVGARVADYGSAASSAQVVIRVLGADGRTAAPEVKLTASVQPRDLVAVKTTLAPLPAGKYTVVTTLLEGGATTDSITHPLTVRTRLHEPPPSQVVRRDGGGFVLGDKPWHPVGVNYWPHNLGGTPTGVYGSGWLDPMSYDPSVVEADLAQLERWGCQAIAAVGADIHWGTGEDTPQLRDLLEFLGRCERHHLKVLLFVAGLDPRGRNDEAAREVIRAVRGHPALMGYDIAWEPWYGPDRKAYTPHWRDWLAQQYGSLHQAEAAFGYALPQDDHGQADAPPDHWLTTDGPWRAIAAAYRGFIDYQLGVEYRCSATVVRSVDPWHLVGFRGSTPGSVLAFKPVEQPSVLHFMDWAGPEGYDVPSYGRLSPEPWVASRGLATRMLSFLSGGKPVVWMEFGLPIYPNGTDWTDDLLHFTPAKYQYQCDEGRLWWQMQAKSGAWGSFVWWYPGGFRVGENSDCGLVDPNNVPRPVAAVAQQLWPQFTTGETRRADTWLQFKPESDPGGWVGQYLRLRDEYERLEGQGKTVDVRTAGQTMESTDCPLLDLAGRPWPGVGPLRYLNAVFERVRIRAEGGEWQVLTLPTAPGQAGDVALPRGAAADIEAWAGNLGEATWLAGQVKLRVGASGAPLEADTPFQGSGHFAAMRVVPRLAEPTTLRLQVEAEGRAQFGEIVEVVLRPEP